MTEAAGAIKPQAALAEGHPVENQSFAMMATMSMPTKTKPASMRRVIMTRSSIFFAAGDCGEQKKGSEYQRDTDEKSEADLRDYRRQKPNDFIHRIHDGGRSIGLVFAASIEKADHAPKYGHAAKQYDRYAELLVYFAQL